jgi:TonB-linked SusC/RagA family outer membrane protein
MRTILLTCLTALGLMLSVSVMAQTKTVTGTVTDADTKETLPGVNVVVKGTTIGVMTDVKGAYSIKASEGQVLQFSSIGYITQEITVGSGGLIDVALATNVQTLNEVVVTAEFGMKRVERSIGSSVQTVKATDIVESGRDNFVSALQGRVAGMNVGSSSGAPGASTTVILRSITSISGNNQPLYVVDGIPMNNSTFDPLSLADAGANFSVRNLDFSSRGNDINPADIESMTVLKGAAAAALYGSDASNGAIIITTKKGTAGKGKITYDNSFRWDKAMKFPDLQEKYGNGAYGTTNWYYGTRYGSEYAAGTKLYDNVSSVMQTGFTSRHSLSFEGGSDKSTLRSSVSWLDGTGVIKTTSYSKLNVTVAGKTTITKWLNIEGSAQYASVKNNKVLSGTEGPIYLAVRWPMTDDARNYLDTDGLHMRAPANYTDTDMLNPYFGLAKNRLTDNSDRFITALSANITPVKNTFVRVQTGWDVGTQSFIESKHPYYSTNNAGTGVYETTKRNFSDPTLNVLAGYSNEFLNKKLSFSVQVGYHQIENGVSQVSTSGTNFFIPDFRSIINCYSVTSSQKTTTRRIQAFSGQIELGYNKMAYLTLRGRNDWSSTLPKANNMFFYPAVEGSFILTEMPFMETVPQISYLKLRASFAQVGKDTNPLSIDPQLIGTGLTGGGFRFDYTGPNPDLKPEMNTSKDVGVEGRLFGDRVNFDITYFWTRCADQIINGFRLSYATGYVLNNMNCGDFKTWGYEAHIDGNIIDKPSGLKWNVGLNLSHTGSKVVYLPENMTEYYNAYTWNSGNTRNGIMNHSAVTALTGLAYQRNTKGDILIDPTTGVPLVNSNFTVLGNREPKIRFGITSNLSYKGLRLSAMFAGRLGATVVNGTMRTMMSNGWSKESVKLREQGPVVFNGVLKDGNENTTNPTTNNISITYNSYGSSIFAGNDEDWIEKDVNYLRLQELRLSYAIPERMFTRVPVSAATVFVAGNDLITWTNYSGIDAVGNTVSAAAGGTGGEGFDVWSLPSPRGFSLGLSITFK